MIYSLLLVALSGSVSGLVCTLAGQESNTADDTCVCMANYRVSGTDCSPCTGANPYSPGGGIPSLGETGGGQVANANKCFSCTTNSVWSGTICECNEDYHADGNGACVKCASGHRQQGDDANGGTPTACVVCTTNSVWSGTACLCKQDHHVNANAACVACASNHRTAGDDENGGSPTTCVAAVVGAGHCQNDISALACRGFEATTDFEVENVAGDPDTYVFKALLMYNKAYQTVTNLPWDKTATITSQTAHGCIYTSHDGTTASNPHKIQVGSIFQCSGSVETGCKSVSNDNRQEYRDGRINTNNQIELADLVGGLTTAGAFELYFQRIQANPISTAFTQLDLKWLAENACKVTVPVEFECTGSKCVEVQNIVCASFAGIDSANYGVVSIECKVPFTFVIHNTAVTNGVNGAATTDPTTISNTFTATNTEGHFTAVTNDLGAGTTANAQACTQGKCQITFKSTAIIPNPTAPVTNALGVVTTAGTSGIISGSIKIEADVKSLGTPIRWTGQLNEFHVARYNLTRASAPEKVLSMPIGVNFYSDQCDQVSIATIANRAVEPAGCDASSYPLNTIALIKQKFPAAIDSVPFLARQDVNLGTLRKHVHGYLRFVAKVAARSSWYLSREITKYEVAAGSNTAVQTFTDKTSTVTTGAGKCTYIGSSPAVASGSGTATDHHTSLGYPVSFMKCPNLMETINAGDVMRFSLKWELGAISSSSGKAVLLQDAANPDPNTQSVEVRLTIQLGGGETNITTGTGGDGTGASVGGTLMYIIVAVAVIAAALVLAVVVVGFMCLRSKSQEQIVSMSPQKCTVAAVYDISVPKKADAMDV